LQHIIGQPQTYTVSPIWYSSEEDGSFSSCLDELQPKRSVAATMAIISFIMEITRIAALIQIHGTASVPLMVSAVSADLNRH